MIGAMRPRRGRPLRRLLAPLGIVVAGMIGCDALTAPGGIGALDFTGIPFPAVVSGDSMRDAAGVATPLTATVYNGRGDVIADATVTFVSLDTGVTIDANGFLRATRRSGSVRLVASAGGLQSQQRVVQVVREPDEILAPAEFDVALQYRIPDNSTNVSPALSFTLRTSDVLGEETPNVAGWLVRWRLIHDGDTLSATDTTKFALWAPSGARHALRDTTKTDGVSSRRLRVYANGLPLQQDSIIVVAEVFSRGVHVPGSPLRYVVTITPPSISPP